jgi:hypothetical protein
VIPSLASPSRYVVSSSEKGSRQSSADIPGNQQKFQNISKDKFRSFLIVLKSVNESFNHFRAISFDCEHVQQTRNRMAQFPFSSMICAVRIVQSANNCCLDLLLSLFAQRSDWRFW